MSTSQFLDSKTIAELTARMYLDTGAVRFMTDKPFIFTSGWASPVYNDSRWLMSFPDVRSALMDFAVHTIERDIGRDKINAVAGGETAGIPFAAWVADRMLAWVFVGVAYGAMTNFAGSLAYFTSQKLYPPALWTWVALLLELLISVSLILGIGTRYGAILVFVFVLIATAIAHRYWEFPAGPQQIGQYNNFLKNISIMAGARGRSAKLWVWVAALVGPLSPLALYALGNRPTPVP